MKHLTQESWFPFQGKEYYLPRLEGVSAYMYEASCGPVLFVLQSQNEEELVLPENLSFSDLMDAATDEVREGYNLFFRIIQDGGLEICLITMLEYLYCEMGDLPDEEYHFPQGIVRDIP